MRVAYVTPRYGPEVVGGAELGVRMFAERLVSKGHEVEVLTSCALDLRTWANELPAGTATIEGVTVHRFATSERRARDFDRWGAPLLAAPQNVAVDRAREWIRRQGPHSPELLDAVGETDADVVVFYPYLYEPTVEGIGRVRGRAAMHPAAHDEAPLRLPVFREVFGAASGFLFQTFAEQALVQQLFPVAHAHQIVMGLGSDPGPGDPQAARLALGLDDDPYLLCLGRVDDGKGTGALARCFAGWRAMRPSPRVRLVLAGPVHDVPIEHPDIVLAGAVDEPTKWGLLRGCETLVSPSGFEAFSLVLIEAWQAGAPVVVNARCAATREHCARSGGGLWYGGYGELCAVLDRLRSDVGLAKRLAANGARYVARHFTWPTIIARYERFLGTVARTA